MEKRGLNREGSKPSLVVAFIQVIVSVLLVVVVVVTISMWDVIFNNLSVLHYMVSQESWRWLLSQSFFPGVSWEMQGVFPKLRGGQRRNFSHLVSSRHAGVIPAPALSLWGRHHSVSGQMLRRMRMTLLFGVRVEVSFLPLKDVHGEELWFLLPGPRSLSLVILAHPEGPPPEEVRRPREQFCGRGEALLWWRDGHKKNMFSYFSVWNAMYLSMHFL